MKIACHSCGLNCFDKKMVVVILNIRPRNLMLYLYKATVELRLQLTCFWILGHYRVKSKKILAPASVDIDPFLFHAKYQIQEHKRISIFKQCLALLNTAEFKEQPLVLIFTDMNLVLKRRKSSQPAHFVQHQKLFLQYFLELSQPFLYLVNKTPISFNGCKKANLRRKKKHLIRTSKFNGAR